MIDGMMDFLFVIALAGMGVVLTLGVNAWVCGRRQIVSFLLGAINFATASVMLWMWLVVFMFYHPSHPAAPFVMSHPWVQTTDWYKGMMTHPRELPGEWQEIGQATFQNRGIGIIARLEVVRECYSPDFLRRQLHNMYAEGSLPDGRPIDDVPDWELRNIEVRYVYYDLEGNYLTSDEPWNHDGYKSLADRDAARDARGIDINPYEVVDRVDGVAAKTSAADFRPQLYTREEIDTMVAQTWDREAPLD